MLPRRDGRFVGSSASACPGVSDARGWELGGSASVVGSDRGACRAAVAAVPGAGASGGSIPASHAALSGSTSALTLPGTVNLAAKARQSLLPGLDPAQRLVQELTARFGKVADFTLDDISHAVIGVFLRHKSGGMGGVASATTALSAAVAGASAPGVAEAPLTGWLTVAGLMSGVKSLGAGLVVGVRAMGK
jgi:hypothetical protein